MSLENLQQFTVGVEEEYMVLRPCYEGIKKPSAADCE